METGHRSVLVMDDNETVQGILAIRDLLELVLPSYLTAPKPSMADSIQYSPMFWQGMFIKEVMQKSEIRIKEVMSPAPLTNRGNRQPDGSGLHDGAKQRPPAGGGSCRKSRRYHSRAGFVFRDGENTQRELTNKEDAMVPEIKKILYATDLSPNSAYALRLALKAANLYQAEIVILHVFERPTIGYAPMLDAYIAEGHRQSLFNERAADIQDKIRKRLEKVCTTEIRANAVYKDTVSSIEIVEGYPAETILNIADDLNCDMIIMGTHGKGHIGKYLSGQHCKKSPTPDKKTDFDYPASQGRNRHYASGQIDSREHKSCFAFTNKRHCRVI